MISIWGGFKSALDKFMVDKSTNGYWAVMVAWVHFGFRGCKNQTVSCKGGGQVYFCLLFEDY